MKYKIVCSLLFLFLLSCHGSTHKDQMNPLHSQDLFGVDLSLSPDDDTFPRWDHELIIQRISEMNIAWTRETVMQSGIEYPRGVYHWENYDEVVTLWQKYNIHLLVTIFGSSNFISPTINNKDFTGEDDENTTAIRNPGYKLVPRKGDYGNASSTLEDWGKFVQEVVERYDGDGYKDMPGLKYPVKYWEGWNEPNYWSPKGGFWNKKWPDEYESADLNFLIKLQKIFYESVKKADPEAVVVGPSLLTRSSYKIDHRKEFYCHPDVYDYFDIVNYHRNHRYSWVNWDSSTQCVNEKPVWVTEFNRHIKENETDHENNVALIKLFIEGGYLTKTRIMRVYHYFQQAENNMYIDVTKPGFPLKELGVFVKTLLSKLNNSTPLNCVVTDDYRQFSFSRENNTIYTIWACAENVNVQLPVASDNIKVTSLDGEEKIIKSEQGACVVKATKEPMYIEELD